MFDLGSKKLKLQCYRCEKNFDMTVDIKHVKPEDYDYREGQFMSHTLGGDLHGNWMKVGEDKCLVCEAVFTIAVSDEGNAICGDGSFAKFCMDNADKRLQVNEEWMTLQERLEEKPDDEKLKTRIKKAEETQEKLEKQEVDRYNKYYEDIANWRDKNS